MSGSGGGKGNGRHGHVLTPPKDTEREMETPAPEEGGDRGGGDRDGEADG